MWAYATATATKVGASAAAVVAPWLAKKAVKGAKEIFTDLAEEHDINMDSLLDIYDDSVFERILKDRSLGLGESYMEGLWDAKDDLADLFVELKTKIDSPNPLSWSWRSMASWAWHYAFDTVFNPQTQEKAKEDVKHYELGLPLYQNMLDERLLYSCARWHKAANLEEAQLAKLKDLIVAAEITSGERVLDLGCGWGGTARFIAENVMDSTVVGVTNSKEQFKYASKHNKHERVTYHCKDYRELLASKLHLETQFDAIVCVGMFEHVGPKNYKSFFEICKRLLKPNGKLLLQTIGCRQANPLEDPWLRKYIFPSGHIPALSQIVSTSEDKFVIEDLANLSFDYHKTLEAWHGRFVLNFKKINEERVLSGQLGFDEKFQRMWTYYLKAGSGLFKARSLQIYQMVFSVRGFEGGYHRH